MMCGHFERKDRRHKVEPILTLLWSITSTMTTNLPSNLPVFTRATRPVSTNLLKTWRQNTSYLGRKVGRLTSNLKALKVWEEELLTFLAWTLWCSDNFKASKLLLYFPALNLGVAWPWVMDLSQINNMASILGWKGLIVQKGFSKR